MLSIYISNEISYKYVQKRKENLWRNTNLDNIHGIFLIFKRFLNSIKNYDENYDNWYCLISKLDIAYKEFNYRFLSLLTWVWSREI